MKNKQVSELIIRSNELSLNDFCNEAVNFLGVAKLGTVIEEKIAGAEKEKNRSRTVFLKTLLSLSNKSILPNVNGDFNLRDILEKYDNSPRDEFIDIHDCSGVEPGKLGLSCFCENDEETQLELNVLLSDIDIISPLKENEIIVANTRAPGYFYALDEDGCSYPLASNTESFIKALIILSMIKSDDIFNSVYRYFELNDNRLSSTGLGVMRRIIDCFDRPMKSMGLSCESKEKYEKLRQTSINQKAPNVDVSEDRLINMLDSIYGKPNNT
jgi:hypothetical protein